VAALLPHPASAANDLDPTFAGDGIVAGPVRSAAKDLALQADGKIVVTGSSAGTDRPSGLMVARLNIDGSMDPTFSHDGVAYTLIGEGTIGYAVEVQSDGKIVAAGYATTGRGDVFVVVRYTTHGALDTSFSRDGIRTASIGKDPYDIAEDMTIQPDGKIVVVGESDENGLDGLDFAILRLLPDGTRDRSFSRDGERIVAFKDYESLATSVAVDAEGNIVVSGTVRADRSEIALARVLPSGAMDASFGSNGRVVTRLPYLSGLGTVLIDDDGRIVGVGGTQGSPDRPHLGFLVARYLPDGSLDPAFSGDGMVKTRIGASAGAQGVAIDAIGRIIAAGTARTGPGTFAFAAARYTRNGRLDTSFSGDGYLTTSISHEVYGHAVEIQADGRAVVAGETLSKFIVARYRAF
jgi:uncharacterized delta-60 repeat protein